MLSPLRERIAIVDDSPVILRAARDTLKDTYDVFTMTDGEKLLQFLEKSDRLPLLILLDVMMPPPNGHDIAKRLKSTPRFSDISIIFLTSRTDAESELLGLSLGAVDYIAKPFSPPLLLQRLKIQVTLQQQKQKLMYLNENLHDLVKKKVKALVALQRTLLTTVADLVEFRDGNTGSHVERTGTLLRFFLEELDARKVYHDELQRLDITLLVESSKLHDVGKIAIRDSILLKPDRLTPLEIEEMRLHAPIGEEIIEKIQREFEENDFLTYAKIMAGAHHERWDGSGYPRRLTGENIPLMGRLMAFADVYDALISKRPYKAPWTHDEALEIIAKDSGKQFDPALLDAFITAADRFQGSIAESGRTA